MTTSEMNHGQEDLVSFKMEHTTQKQSTGALSSLLDGVDVSDKLKSCDYNWFRTSSALPSFCVLLA